MQIIKLLEKTKLLRTENYRLLDYYREVNTESEEYKLLNNVSDVLRHIINIIESCVDQDHINLLKDECTLLTEYVELINEQLKNFFMHTYEPIIPSERKNNFFSSVSSKKFKLNGGIKKEDVNFMHVYAEDPASHRYKNLTFDIKLKGKKKTRIIHCKPEGFILPIDELLLYDELYIANPKNDGKSPIRYFDFWVKMVGKNQSVINTLPLKEIIEEFDHYYKNICNEKFKQTMWPWNITEAIERINNQSSADEIISEVDEISRHSRYKPK